METEKLATTATSSRNMLNREKEEKEKLKEKQGKYKPKHERQWRKNKTRQKEKIEWKRVRHTIESIKCSCAESFTDKKNDQREKEKEKNDLYGC